jgi:hypothetical protein
MSDVINHSNFTNIDEINNFFEVFGYIFLTIFLTLITIYFISILRIRSQCCDKFFRYLIQFHPNTRIRNRIEINDSNSIEINHYNSIEIGEIVSCDEIQFDNCCIICLETLNQENIFKLKCNHCFHIECWNQWEKATSKSICPLCRFEI